jgi:hypothetical protein
LGQAIPPTHLTWRRTYLYLEQLNTSSFIHKSSNGVGDALLLLSPASLCHNSIDKVQGNIEVVADKCKEILLSKDSNLAGEDGLLAPIAGFVAIGEVPGLACFTLNICTTAKKNSVAKYVRILQEITSNVCHRPWYIGGKVSR